MILETHSEHFLKSLQNHLRSGTGLSDEEVVILYVDSDNEEKETEVRRVRTSKGEFIDSWPRDVYMDDTDPII